MVLVYTSAYNGRLIPLSERRRSIEPTSLYFVSHAPALKEGQRSNKHVRIVDTYVHVVKRAALQYWAIERLSEEKNDYKAARAPGVSLHHSVGKSGR